MRKLGLFLIPWLSLLFVVFCGQDEYWKIGAASLTSWSLCSKFDIAPRFCPSIDSGTVTLTAQIQLYNMEKDLNITDTQYLLALTIFFIRYELIICTLSPYL